MFADKIILPDMQVCYLQLSDRVMFVDENTASSLCMNLYANLQICINHMIRHVYESVIMEMSDCNYGDGSNRDV